MTANAAPDDPTPPTPPVAWAGPTAGDPASTGAPVGLWLIAIIVQVGFVLLRAGSVLGDELSSRAMGYIVGTALAGPVVALVIRWIYVRVRGGGPVLRSRWVPIAIIVMAGASLFGGLRAG